MYSPANVPDDPNKLAAFLRLELQRIAEAGAEGIVYLTPQNAAPAKPRDGQVVKADGTNWNPGGGNGVYAYYAGAWNKL